MSQQSRNLWHVLALWTILAALAVPSAAEDDDPEEDAPAKVVERIAESNFDQWVFQERVQLAGNRIVHRSGTADAARAKIDSQLKATLDELVKICDLTETQRRKLSLAASGDIKQFFDQVEEVRKKFLKVKNDPNGLNQIWPEIGPLQQLYGKGLFGEESLFAKSLRKTLTEQQQAKYQSALLERRRAGYRIAIEASLARLGNGVVLRREQREMLLNYLMAETSPPLQFGQHDREVVLFELSKLPTEILKKELDKAQWKQLQPQLLQASGTEGYLAEIGVIEEPKPTSVVIIRSVRTVVVPQ